MTLKQTLIRMAAVVACMSIEGRAAAQCLPPINAATHMPKWVVAENPRGCWVGWWCPDATQPYIAAATKKQCSLVGVKRAAAAWLSDPDAAALKFGSDPHTDPALLAVWKPDEKLLEAVR